MLRKAGFLMAVALAAMVMFGVLLIQGEQQTTMATQALMSGDQAPSFAPGADPIGTGAMTQVTHTVTLPLVMSNYSSPRTSPFGIVIYGNLYPETDLALMRDAGTGWVTTSLYWAVVEPTKGVYNWDYFDTKAQNAQAAGMNLFVLFTRNPTWAAELPAGPVTDTQDLVDFATLMVERYDCDGTDDAPGHPCVNHWSLYGEPDNGSPYEALAGKGYWGHDGVGYAEMLSQVAPAMHQASSKAHVMIGGLAYDWFEEDGGPFVRSFLTDTLTALNNLGGAGLYIDDVAVHYYPISQLRWPSIREKFMEIEGIMSNHGAADIPLICPEMGYWSSPLFGSSEQKQAQRLVQMFVGGLSRDVPMLSWYKINDTVVGGSADDLYPDRTSGLVRVDGSLKPSYYAYQTMARELEGMAYARDLQSPGVEGYVFARADGHEKTVLWSRAGTVPAVFAGTHLRVVALEGAVTHVYDNQAGDVDGGVVGQIAIQIDENQPTYVEVP